MMLTQKISLALVLFLFTLSACAEAVPTEVDVDAMMTAGIGTMVMSYFETQTAVAPTITVESEPTQPLPSLAAPDIQAPVPTLTSQPVLVYFTPTLGTLTPGTPTPTGTLATAMVNPSTLATGCYNLALIRDDTVPAGTKFQPGEDFRKTWKVQNTGTCEWPYHFQVAHLSGQTFGYEASRIQKNVGVGSWAEISIELQAPKSPGTYSGYWRLTEGGGKMFGATLGVSIVVVSPTNTPPPTSTSTSTATATATATSTSTSTPTATESQAVVSP